MHVLASSQDGSGYTGAGTTLAFGALGVIAGVRLLGLRSRGLALGLAWVGILMWLTVGGFVAGPHRGFGSLAIFVLGVAGCVYVILALRRWRDRFPKAGGSVAASLGTSTFTSSPVPRDGRPSRFRSVVVVVAGAGLVLTGPVLALPGLVVFIDWLAGALESAAPTGAFCPSTSSYCTAASAKAGVLGLLAVGVGVLGLWAGVNLLRKTRRGAEDPTRNQRGIVTRGRGLVLVLALSLTTVATAGILLYARPVHEPISPMVMVLVSKVDIPAKTDLDQLINDDQFKIILVPLDVVVDGAITSIDYLKGKTSRVPILAGEQIPVARIKGA
jgi:SAF domain-containing protein